MASKKIGCSAGKTSLVDPNAFAGQDSVSNISVPLEDLNISVQLTTFKKGRTVLTTNGSNGTSESSDTLRVKFIEGAEINGKKIITTDYTDLTTTFNESNQSENLGITNIDIDFNSSYAPMITINFIDVRGGAIFQNDNYIKDGSNKYSTFFQLPYPLYELTIKGYYGQPVKYCLHMTKFVSRFNSQTGNFEITANFIGYTYAMLSDMLLGYLKVIPYTNIGEDKYKEINLERHDAGLPDILTLNQLMDKISGINKGLEKITSNDSDSNLIKISENKISMLDSILDNIAMLGRSLDINKEDLDTYDYIIVDDINDKNGIDTYKNNVSQNITDFNLDFSVNLISSEFTEINNLLYINLTTHQLNPNTTLSEQEETSLRIKLKNPKDFETKRAELFEKVKTLAGEKVFSLYDMSSLYLKIKKAKDDINKNVENAKKDLAVKLKTFVSKKIGFDPTVRNIVEVFTTAVEVFLSTIHKVSLSAEKNDNRRKQLEKKFTNTSNTDLVDSLKFFPWPDYKEDNEKEGYVEKYLGEAFIGSNESIVVDELLFIDDLLKAFLKAKKEGDLSKLNLENELKNWIPISPLDTRIFTQKSPYNRIKPTNTDDVLRLMLIRGITYLGYSNSDGILTDIEIQSMANYEADMVLTDISDSIIKSALTQIKLKNIIDITGKINNKTVPVIQQRLTNGVTHYAYDYIFEENLDGFNVVPISDGFVGDWNEFRVNDGSNPKNMSQGLIQRSKSDVFLTNYSSGKFDSNNQLIPKYNDGGVYIKFLNLDEYNSNVNELNTTVETKSEFILDKLKQKIVGVDSGFNAFGGDYGIQEFINLDYGEQELTGLPLRFVFFDDNKLRGLGNNRNKSNSDVSKGKTNYLYDLNNSINGYLSKTIYVPNTLSEIQTSIYGSDSDKLLHKNYGKNRVLFNNLKDDLTISYPYVNTIASYGNTNDLDKISLVSLFGSMWYYGQDSSQYPNYSKALLFLNTIPWNGNSFEANEIKHLFDKKGGFIHAPRLWCAYIGGLIWRADFSLPTIENGKIIRGGSGLNDPIQWYNGANPIAPSFDNNSIPPTRDSYFRVLNGKSNHYDKYNDLLITLPYQVKDEFKRIFFDFVNGDDEFISWASISSNLEIWDNTASGFQTAMVSLKSLITTNSENIHKLNTIELSNRFINIDKYDTMTPIYNTGVLTNFLFLELKGGYNDNEAIRTIIDALKEELVIVNSGYAIWDDNSQTQNKYQKISVRKDVFDLYFNTIVKNFNDKSSNLSTSKIKKQDEQEIFGTTNENVIKLQLYRTCKNIYDKWIGGAKDGDNIMFQCGDSNGTPLRNDMDGKIAIKLRGESAKPRLIDSFRFVTRSFRDIGDELYINPLPVNDYLQNNPNTNFYDAVTSLLSANNFDFIALPSYINYNDEKTLESMFETSQYSEAIQNGICGPSFVCVYLGQNSKHLDFRNSEYQSDGFDVTCIDGNMSSSVPKDLTVDSDTHENNVAVFAVNYGQQNQNIFKDITLDQSEFSETAESLQIIDDISKKGSENNRTLAGQNIYNVYSVRSYKTEVEMMGNAMIQPMMYFQLNNIPMFHGAYMITHVKHSIKPNFMSTNFTGVRIRSSETKLLDSTDLYMSLLDSIDISESSSTPINNNSNNLEENTLPDPSIIKLGFVNPFENDAPITSAPGIRSLDGRVKNHEGVDFATQYGTNLQSIYNGTVEWIKYNRGGYGLYMVINHGVLGDDKKVYKSVYGHFSDIDKSIVDLSTVDIDKILNGYNPKIQVKTKQIIGKSGGTPKLRYLDNINKKYDQAGHSTGAHLHYELRIGDSNQIDSGFKSIKYVNPVPYLPIGLNPIYSKFLPKETKNGDVVRIPTPTNAEKLKSLGKI